VKYSHITRSLKRPKVIQTKDPDEELGDNTCIWEYLARDEGTFEENHTLKQEVRQCF